MRSVRVFCVVLATVTLATSAFAQGVENFRTAFVSFGTGVGLSGNVIEEATGTIAGQPARDRRAGVLEPLQ